MFHLLRGSQSRIAFGVVVLLLLVVSGCNSHPPAAGDSFLHFGDEARNAIKSFNKTICTLPEDSDMKLYSAYIPEGEALPITLSYKDTKRHAEITIVQVPGADSLQIREEGQNISKNVELYVYGKRINVFFTREADKQEAYASFRTRMGSISVKIERDGNISTDYVKRILEQMVDSQHGIPCMNP